MSDNIKTTRKVQTGRFRLLKGGKSSQKEEDFFDYNLLAVIILLTAFGLVMQYSVTAYSAQVSHSSGAFLKQSAVALAGIVLLVLVSRLADYHKLAAPALMAYVISIGLCVITHYFGVEVNGARRWIRLAPGVQFQPAELVKLSVILLIPLMIVKMGRRFRGYKAPVTVAAPSIVAFLVIRIFTDNLSSALIVLGITYVVIVVAHPHPKWLIVLFAALAGAAFVAFLVLKGQASAGGAMSENFRLRRIFVWLDPENHQSDGGYQVMQGLYAIGSGGIFGKGLGNSAQKLGALPEAENDMIFAIICEELGIVGAMIVLALFVYLLFRLFFIAINAPDLLGSLISVGIFAHIAIQVILNIAVVLNVIPTTGITLPFVSYGGTSLMFLMIEMGIALNISGQITDRKKK